MQNRSRGGASWGRLGGDRRGRWHHVRSWGGCRRTNIDRCQRNNFNRVDLRVFYFARKAYAKNPVGHFDGHGFNISAVRSARFDPNIKIVELASLHIEGEYAFPGAGYALVGFGKIKFRDVFAIGNFAGKCLHGVMFALKQLGGFCGCNRNRRIVIDRRAAFKTLLGQPDIAARIGKGGVFTSLDPERPRCRRRIGSRWQVAFGHDFLLGKFAHFARELDFIGISRKLTRISDANFVVLEI